METVSRDGNWRIFLLIIERNFIRTAQIHTLSVLKSSDIPSKLRIIAMFVIIKSQTVFHK